VITGSSTEGSSTEGSPTEGSPTESFTSNVYKYELNSPDLSLLLQSQWDSKVPVISPDGKKMAFVTNRTGASEVWVKDLESNKFYQVTGDLILVFLLSIGLVKPK